MCLQTMNCEILVQKMDYENKEIICIGDFTCDWLSPEKSETKKLSDFACFSLNNLLKNQHELLQLSNSNADMIDLVFSNRPETIIKSSVDHIEGASRVNFGDAAIGGQIQVP